MKAKGMLKIVVVFTVVSLVMLGLTSCGKKGADGKPFIKLDWDGTVLHYVDDMPGTPETVVKDTYYETKPGTWSFEYIHANNDDVLWKGTVTLEKGKAGEDGGLFSDGADGDDIYYEIHLYGFIGPQLYEWGTTRMSVADLPSAKRADAVQTIVQNGTVITLEVEKVELSQ